MALAHVVICDACGEQADAKKVETSGTSTWSANTVANATSLTPTNFVQTSHVYYTYPDSWILVGGVYCCSWRCVEAYAGIKADESQA